MKSAEALIFVFFAGLLAFNWPLLEIFRFNTPLFLFVSWLVFIILVALADRVPGSGLRAARKQGN